MKKFLTILFSLLIILSGMHLGVATHLCGGKFYAIKLIIPGNAISCGMETSQSDCPDKSVKLSKYCCENYLTFFSTDNDYEIPSSLIKTTIFNESQVFLHPESLFGIIYKPCTRLLANVSHFKPDRVETLNPEDICIFRI